MLRYSADALARAWQYELERTVPRRTGRLSRTLSVRARLASDGALLLEVFGPFYAAPLNARIRFTDASFQAALPEFRNVITAGFERASREVAD